MPKAAPLALDEFVQSADWKNALSKEAARHGGRTESIFGGQMKRLALGLFILMAVPLSMARGGTDFFRSNSSDHASSAIASEDAESDRLAEKNSNGASGTLTVYTLFRFDSNYGEILVQPIFGRVNGARVCVSW